jgi:adhesin transport system membrane fusion protein
MILENRNISKKELKKSSKKLAKNLNYIDSRSQALLLSTTKSSRLLIWTSFLFIITLLSWMQFSEINQLIRGVGRVVPSSKMQTIQNLEGGIVSKVLVKEGDMVKENDILIELDKKNFKSKEKENRLKIYELKARILRLEAESKGKKLILKKGRLKEKLKQELQLYKVNKNVLAQEVNILKKQLFQKQNELKEKRAKKENLAQTLSLTQEEVQMKQDLLAQLVGSRNELNLAQQKLSSIKGEFSSTKLAIPRLISAIEEVKSQIKQTKIKFQKRAVEELTLAKDELARVKQLNISKKDRVSRATVRSPVAGVVQKLFFNTIGGVVKAGEKIMQIVPTDDTLIIESKIRPSDIAFIRLKQEVIVRFTAYDFSIYGSLKGKVIHISADTMLDEADKKSYYQVQIKTHKNYLSQEKDQLKIMTGMVATVDVISGKQSIMNYILKPILRAKFNVMSER